MSSGAKRTLAAAQRDAEAFRALFDGCYDRWEIAGSVRREKPLVGDVEAVVIPRTGDVSEDAGLFRHTRTVNLLLYRRQELLAAGKIAKHLYTIHHEDGSESLSPKWGDLFFGCSFAGFRHEVYCTNADSWGAQLLIRTGPADFSQRVVDTLRRQGTFRQQDGVLVRVATGEVVPVEDERAYLKLAGMKWVEPKERV